MEDAVEAARENAKLNGLDNCRFIAGDVLVQVLAAALRVAHLAEHAAVRAGDALNGQQRAIGVVALIHGGLASRSTYWVATWPLATS